MHNLGSVSNGDFEQRAESGVSDISTHTSKLDKKRQGAESRTHLYHYLSKDIKDIKHLIIAPHLYEIYTYRS